MRRIGWIPFTSNLRAASVRLRCYNIVHQLKNMGQDVEVVTVRDAAASRILVLSKRYDDEACRLARSVRSCGGAVVLDLCDNHFHGLRGPDELARSGQIRHMLAEIDHLVVSTTALAAEVKSHAVYEGPLSVIGDAVEDVSLDRVPLRWRSVIGVARLDGLREWALRRGQTSHATQTDCTRRGSQHVRLVWFGAHGVSYADGGMLDLLEIRQVLRRLRREYDLSLTVISNNWSKYHRHIRDIGVRTRYFEWSPHAFANLLQAHDLCVIPIRDNPFTRCKSNNRPATALWHGVPVVATAIPSYEEFRPFTMLDEWENGLRTYIERPDVAGEHVRLAREHLMKHYSLDAIAARWLAVFNSLLEGR